jgi:hypothetical protein
MKQRVRPNPADALLTGAERREFERRWVTFVEDNALIRVWSRDIEMPTRTFDEWSREALEYRFKAEIQGTAAAISEVPGTIRDWDRISRGESFWTADHEAQCRERAGVRFAFGQFQPPEDPEDLPTPEQLIEWERRRLPDPRRRDSAEVARELKARGMLAEYTVYNEVYEQYVEWAGEKVRWDPFLFDRITIAAPYPCRTDPSRHLDYLDRQLPDEILFEISEVKPKKWWSKYVEVYAARRAGGSQTVTGVSC